MGKVLKADASAAAAYVSLDLTPIADVWVTSRILVNSAAVSTWTESGGGNVGDLLALLDSGDGLQDGFSLGDPLYTAVGGIWFWDGGYGVAEAGNSPAADSIWHTFEFHHEDGVLSEFFIDSETVWSVTPDGAGPFSKLQLGVGVPFMAPNPTPGAVVYYDDVKVGTTRGASDIFSDTFESGNLSAWTSTSGAVSVVDDPQPYTSMNPGRRVGIAFNDDPLEPDPTWIWLDDATVFPANFVTGYDTKNGRQGLLGQTETGTATVYVNDRKLGLFDDRNTGSPYYGLLSGRQIILQLWDPVALAWEKQFGGWIENYSYDIDGSAVANPWADPEDRTPLNASIQIECVDMFDFLAGFGLTPGLAGVRPPSGAQDGVWYAEATVQGRQIEILADVGIPPEMRGPEDGTGTGEIAQGNVHVVAVKYDPDESALAALRDAADAEFPFIANIYIDRRGRYQFHGRYARFDPDGVAAEAGSHWDFTRWKVGDGAAITIDSDRAQMRVLAFERSRMDIINAALCYPQGIDAADMPNQVYVSTGSITAYGKHDAPPMSDLLTSDDLLVDGLPNAMRECFRFAKLLVKNKASPREAITALQVKAIRPSDHRAETTWAFITTSDIGHIVNVAVGYPGGVGFVGDSPQDDYYIEGRALRVRPLNPEHDYVEYDINVSPAVWSMDTHNVFPPFSGPTPPSADFTFEETDPGTFDFTDQSMGGILVGPTPDPIASWAWDFGDASGTSTDQNPTYTYGSNGTYDVTLTITTDSSDTDDETKPVRVTDIP